MELSKRLSSVANMVTSGRHVADIGCDHGYVSIYLLTHQIAHKVIAMDVNKGPLLRAREHIEEVGLAQVIETRLSDGAAALKKGEADTAVIAGMGGKLMIRILSEAAERLGNFTEVVLQPQSEIFKVREYLFCQGYDIINEDMVYEDGKYYQIMKAVVGNSNFQGKIKKTALRSGFPEQTVKTAFLHYGSELLTGAHPVCKQFLEYEKENVGKIKLHILNQEQTEDTVKRLEELSHKLELVRCAESIMQGGIS